MCASTSDGPTFEVSSDSPGDNAGGSSASASSLTAAAAASPHQILEFFEMCCALITTLAK